MIDKIESLVINVEAVNIADADPRIVGMLQTIIDGQQAEVTRDTAEVQRDAEEKARDMTFAQDVNTLLGQIRQRTDEIKADQADLIQRLANNPSDAEKAQILADFESLNTELGGIASGYTPVPVTPGEVPGTTPVPEPEPGTGDGGVPTDGGTGDGGTGDGGAGGAGDGTPTP